MARIVRISTIQLPTIIDGNDFQAKQRNNMEEIAKWLTVAGERTSDLVLFGEYANLHHRTWSDNRLEYVPDPIPGAFTQMIGSYAAKYGMNIVIPMFGVYKRKLSSYAVVIDRKGAIIGCYQKTHPTLPEQAIGIQQGNNLPVFTMDFGIIGIMTCMDIEYPEVAQILMLKGAELLLFPHVQAGWGEVEWEIRYRSRAIDTGLYVISACYGYREGEWKPGMMIGRSGIVGRDGLILADLGRSIGLLTQEIDLDSKRLTSFYFDKQHDRTLAVIASRRPEIYKDLVASRYRKKALNRIQQ